MSSSATPAPTSRCSRRHRSGPQPGQTSAIIGSTGAGKTTLLYLIPRLFDVTGGAWSVDGVDVRDLEPDAALVGDRPGPADGRTCSPARSVEPAVRQARATDEEMWQALEVAQAEDFVAAMPGGLDAPIAQGGTNVSGGQRQRLAIARALVRKPDLPVRRLVLGARPGHRRPAARGAAPGPRDGRCDRRAAGLHDQRRRPDHRAGGRPVVGSGTHEELLDTARPTRRSSVTAHRGGAA